MRCPVGSTTHLYAVFDGHGGPSAAVYCTKHFGIHMAYALEELYSVGAELEDAKNANEVISKQMQRLDEEVRAYALAKDYSGTTMSCLVVRQFEDGRKHLKIW